MTSHPHVLVDATAIPADRGGVGRYLEHLLPALAATDVQVTIACQPRDADWFTSRVPGARIEAARSTGRSRAVRLLWEQFQLPRLARRVGADLIFSPHYTMPVRAGVPVVVTLHDATFFSHPELHSRVKGIFFRRWTRISLRRAVACLVPSKATRSELLAHARPARDNMTVAYHGVDAATFHPPTADERTAEAERLGSPNWITFLGTIEPRKNVSAIVRAFEEITQPADLRLVLAGSPGWDTTVDSAIEKSSARSRIDRLGFVADAELSSLIGGARCFVYPSLGEGFGLPVLEAMACGTVVVTTPYLALPEVGGDVAIYSEPDAASLARALQLAIGVDQAYRRQAGIERAAGFTWATSAGIHAGVFAAAAGGR